MLHHDGRVAAGRQQRCFLHFSWEENKSMQIGKKMAKGRCSIRHMGHAECVTSQVLGARVSKAQRDAGGNGTHCPFAAFTLNGSSKG